MGKDRRPRKKLHISAKTKSESFINDDFVKTMDTSPPILLQPSNNLFAGIHIDLDGLRKNLEDTRSIKSFQSVKSETAVDKTLPKKDKLKLRRDLLLKKIDALNQLKLENKMRKKRANVSIIGDTNPLRDALPSLDWLLENTSSTSVKNTRKAKQKCIEKASKRKKQLVQDVQIFKKLIANKDLQNSPFKVISERVHAIVSQENIKQK